MCNKRTTQGFTLIELVVIILLLGIMATTVIPKFIDARGSEEVAVQNQLVSMLRTIQLRRMQQIDVEQCFTVRFTDFKALLLATDTANPPNCLPDNTPNDDGYNTTILLDDSGDVSFDIVGAEFTLSFEGSGRPTGGCAGGCEITIVGQSTRKVSINAEGFIESVNE